MRFAMSSSPHIRCGDNTRRIMLDVLIALLPTLLAGTIFFGLRCLLLAAVSIAAAGLAEALWNKLTGRYQTVEDLSAAVTGLLLALTLPATVPYWMAAVGAVFAVIVVKAAFGGLGQNIFNPALAARALLLLLFPASMTRFAAPGASVPLDLGSADVVTAATPLHSMVMPALPDVPLSEMFLGSIGGCIGEVSALALLIGGGYLVVRGVIKLRIPVSYLGTMAVLSTHAPTLTSTDWYDVGMEDAISGSAIKDDDAFSDSQADRGLYLKGYAEGQKKTCQTDFTYARGLSGKSFPASCNNVENASQLHEVWRKGADENASTIRLN